MTINTDPDCGGPCTQTWSSTAACNITTSPGRSAGLSDHIVSVPSDRNMASLWGPNTWNWHGLWWYQEPCKSIETPWVMNFKRKLDYIRTNNPNVALGCSLGLDVTSGKGGKEATNISPFIPHHFHLFSSASFHNTWTILFSFHSLFSTTHLLIVIAPMDGLVYISSPGLDYENPGWPVGIFHIPWLSSIRRACAWVQSTWKVMVWSFLKSFFFFFKEKQSWNFKGESKSKDI